MAREGSSLKTWCDHLAFLSSDITSIPNSDGTPCEKCQEPSENWFCLSCKGVFCSRKVKGHIAEHYRQTGHCLASLCRDQAIFCSSCIAYLDAQVIPQLRSILSPSNASKGLRKIFDRGLEALADHEVQKEFLTYSAIFLADHQCPSELKVNLSSFGVNLSEEISAFLQAQHELKVASNLSASITQKKLVLLQQTSKYAEAKKEILATDGKVANLKTIIKELESHVKNVEACLAMAESDREKTPGVLDTIETQVTTIREIDLRLSTSVCHGGNNTGSE